MKKFVGITVTVVVVFVVCLLIAICNRSNDLADSGKKTASGATAPAQNSPDSMRGTTTVKGPNSVTSTQTLVGLPAEIDALGDAAKRTGGKVNGVVILDARKKSQALSLPMKPESREAMAARDQWENMKIEYGFAHRAAMTSSMQFGKNSSTANSDRGKEYRAAQAVNASREEYENLLRNEGFTEAQIAEKVGP